jgi:hypothetical protein
MTFDRGLRTAACSHELTTFWLSPGNLKYLH